ncbi:MAG: CDP-alcohol phosphatidyltransferase family protein [Clostridia bacterium]|nr:CDP-alcohol phosphatidyltransferase family protein [Clostridia bacterium]
MKKYITIPNCITSVRIVGSVSMFFTKSLSTLFFIIYTLCGISDALDGHIARKTGTTSEFGTKLDSFADLLFYFVMFLKVFPMLAAQLTPFLWSIAICVVSIRIFTYIMVAVKHKHFASLHTYANKITGLVIFSVPYFLVYKSGVAICSVLALVSTYAAIEELIIHLRSSTYDSTTKTLLTK